MSRSLRKERYTNEVIWNDLPDTTIVKWDDLPEIKNTKLLDDSDTDSDSSSKSNISWYQTKEEYQSDWINTISNNNNNVEEIKDMVIVNVPGDGSCFYHCIAKALQECRAYLDKNFVKLINSYMLTYLYCNNKIDVDDIDEKICENYPITYKLIRYICGTKIDDDDFESHNMILMADNKTPLKEKKDLVNNIIESNDFAECVEINTLITKGFGSFIGIFIIDDSVENNIVYISEEWTKDKIHYIILKRESLHYNLVQTKLYNTRRNLLLDYKTAHEFIKTYNIK